MRLCARGSERILTVKVYFRQLSRLRQRLDLSREGFTQDLGNRWLRCS
jgi:hypothetical protein